jgi:hypothetical protein
VKKYFERILAKDFNFASVIARLTRKSGLTVVEAT